MSGHRLAAGAALFAAFALQVAPAAANVTTINGEFDLPGNVAAGGGWIASTQAGFHAQLYVGRLGAAVTKVPGTLGIPYWGQPHFGTTAEGATVLVFPSCEHGDCDLRMLDPASGKVTPVPGGSSPAVNEVEGDLDRGALAFVRAPQHRATSPKMQLVYRAAGAALRTLNRLGGEKVELDRGRILTVRVAGHAPDGDCGTRLIDLTTVAGRTRTVARITCGEDERSVIGAGFVGRQRVAWAVSAMSGTTFFQRDLPSGRTRSVPSLHKGIAYAPVSSTRGLLFGGEPDYASGPPSDPDADFQPFALYDVTGIQMGATDAKGQLPNDRLADA